MSRRTEDDHPQQRTLWYTRRGVSIRGPFPEELVRRYVLLGRLGEDDEVSRDCTFWESLSAHPELIPELVIEARTSDEARERLMAAQLREDERDVSERRSDGVSDPARGAPEATHGERRGGGERRGPEPDWMVRYRRLRSRTLRDGVPQRTRYGVVVVIIALVVGLLWYAAMRGPGPVRHPGTKCNAAPAPGVDWSYCTLEGLRLSKADLSRADLRSVDLRGADLAGARLVGADLSYGSFGIADLAGADLTGARLVGTGLSGADLRGADLSRSDLSYANLRGARLAGARLTGANLNQAIWTDGRICAQGSVGECR
ncbi:serine/threonine-protein kinase B [bacterium BMS3Bbin12]|nr:serine/threonine-protein kinase B [bacterium BMS3Abin12]GBE47780.1 serine/threonine-protein kinase B [bacterium BMS3Bbin12]GBE49890.1 serine/threonine-protein kinase B [bacterium BMS3Bbin13]